MLVYVDESGDLGWRFSHPYRAGGSSRFLCVAIMFVPKIHRKLPKGIISAMHKKYGWKDEKKASDASPQQKMELAQSVVGLLAAHNDIKIDCIVVRKEKVQAHIRADSNKLYNYMCKLVVCDYVTLEPEIQFIPDKRSIKVESGNSLSDYLQTVLWFECNVKTKIVNKPQESFLNYNLQFIDWVAHCVWSSFEDNETAISSKLLPSIKVRRLYF